MKISELITELKNIKDEHGDIDAQLQGWPQDGEPIETSDTIFCIAEVYGTYETSTEMICNIRAWPY